jgi:hypothetical protein
VSGEKRYAFIFGCGRSGTTALARLLNLHPDVCIGYERYAALARGGQLSPELYEPERFRDFRSGDGHHSGYEEDKQREPVLTKIEHATVVGDKLPQMSGNLDQLHAFPNVKLIFIVREPFGVAGSFDARNRRGNWAENLDFRAGVEAFNAAMKSMSEVVENDTFDYIVVNYRRVFRDRAEHERIYRFLGVDPARANDPKQLVRRAQQLSEKGRGSEVVEHVVMHSDFQKYRALAVLAGPRQDSE